MIRVRIIVMAKAPVAGFAKTRLIPALGPEGAARLAARMLLHTLAEALRVPDIEVELCITPGPSDPAWTSWHFPDGVQVVDQGDGDLGARLARASARAFAAGVHPIFIGTDCPALDTGRLRRAVAKLNDRDAFIHGTVDGGYALLALASPVPAVFSDIPWSTSDVFRLTVERLLTAGVSLETGEPLADIDDPTELQHVPKNWLEALTDEHQI